MMRSNGSFVHACLEARLRRLRFLPAACLPVPGIGRQVEMTKKEGFSVQALINKVIITVPWDAMRDATCVCHFSNAFLINGGCLEWYASCSMPYLRARQKITSHFRRRCIPPDCVAKILNMLDIHAFSRLVSRAPQHLKLRIYFLPDPKHLAEMPGLPNPPNADLSRVKT